MADEQNTSAESDRTLLSDLIERYITERITETECVKLNGLLETNAENKDYFRQQLDTHFLLQELLTSESTERSVSGIMDWCALRAFAVTQNTEPTHKHTPSASSASFNPKQARHSLLFTWVVLPTILLAAVFGVYTEFFRHETSMPKYESFAQIMETVDVEWGEGNTVFKPGANIGNEFVRFDKGAIKIRIQNGAELILEGPTEFIISGKLRTFCQRGKVNALIPKTAQGFELTTPFARIVDLGTEFSVVVDNEATDIHMLSGKAEISRDKNNRLPLIEGNAIRIPKIGDTESLLLNPSICLRSELFEKLLASFLSKRIEIREAQEKRFINDPDILGRFDGVDFQGPGRGVLYGGRKVSLPKWDKTVTRLRSSSDGIEFNIDGEHSSLTLLMMARIFTLNHVSRLFIGEDYYEKPGTFLWQLDQNGDIQFRVHSSGAERFIAFDASKGFQMSDLGTWTMLAVTMDANHRVIRHYKDGEQIAEIPWRNPEPLRLDHLSVGNESRKSNQRFQRFLNGEIAELQIYRRVLGPEEIKKIHDNAF